MSYKLYSNEADYELDCSFIADSSNIVGNVRLQIFRGYGSNTIIPLGDGNYEPVPYILSGVWSADITTLRSMETTLRTVLTTAYELEWTIGDLVLYMPLTIPGRAAIDPRSQRLWDVRIVLHPADTEGWRERTTNYLLLETGDGLLLETGDGLLLEA